MTASRTTRHEPAPMWNTRPSDRILHAPFDGDELDELFGRANPNPMRLGCPPFAVLEQLARRQRPLGDPGYEHLATCSECYLDTRALQITAQARTRARRIRAAWLAAAATLLIAVGGTWQATRSGRSGVDDTSASVVSLDARDYAITRGHSPDGSPPYLVLPRAAVRLTVLLPNGFEAGPYTLDINRGGTTALSASGTAIVQDQIAALRVPVDTRGLAPGTYQLVVRQMHAGMFEVPLTIR